MTSHQPRAPRVRVPSAIDQPSDRAPSLEGDDAELPLEGYDYGTPIGVAWEHVEHLDAHLAELLAVAQNGRTPTLAEVAKVEETGAHMQRLYQMSPDELRAEQRRRRALRDASTTAEQDAPTTVRDWRPRPDDVYRLAEETVAAVVTSLAAPDVPPATDSERQEIADGLERLRGFVLRRASSYAESKSDERPEAELLRLLEESSLDERFLEDRALRLRRVLGVMPTPAEMIAAVRLSSPIERMRSATAAHVLATRPKRVE